MIAILLILKQKNCVINISYPSYVRIKSCGYKCDQFHPKISWGWWVEVNLVREKSGGGNSKQILIIWFFFPILILLGNVGGWI